MRIYRIILYGVLVMSLYACTRVRDHPAERLLTEKEVAEDLAIYNRILAASHPALYAYVSQRDLNRLSLRLFSKEEKITVRTLFNRLSAITDRIGCAHTGLNMPSLIYHSLLTEKAFFPFPIGIVNEKILVNAYGYSLPFGTEITSINGASIKTIPDSLSIYETNEGIQHRPEYELIAENFSVEYYLNFGESSAFYIEGIDSSGARVYCTEKAISLAEANRRNEEERYYFDHTDTPFDLSLSNDEQFATMRISTFEFNGAQAETGFDNFCYNSFELLYAKPSIKTLIIDLRGNGGGNLENAANLFSYMASVPFPLLEKAEVPINLIFYPQYLADLDDSAVKEKDDWMFEHFKRDYKGIYIEPDSFNSRYEPKLHAFRGKILVLTNAVTGSSASYFAAMVKYSGRGKIVGTPCRGGNHSGSAFSSLTYRLPHSGIELYFPLAHITYYYRAPTNTGETMQPDYLVPDDVSSFRGNTDRQLEFVTDSLLKRL